MSDIEKISVNGTEYDINGEKLAHKAEIDGAYEQMTVGNAEQLVGTTFEEDSVPYNFRTSGGSIDIGDREYVDAIVGGTVAWNQLIPIAGSSKTKTESNVTITDNRDGSYTVQTTQDGASADVNLTLTSATTSKGGHVGILYGCPSGGYVNNSVKYRLWDAWGGIGNDYGNGHVGKWVAGGQFEIRISVASGTVITTPIKFVPQLFDLTQMFGSTIADYIYSLETATAGAGVAFFRKLFPKPYYAYNAGKLMSVKTSAHNMVGFNAVEDFIVNAQANPYATVLFAKGELLPNTDYCISFEGAEGNYVYANENLFNYKNIMVTSGRTYAVIHTKDVVSKENTLQWDVNRNAWIILKNNGTNAVTPSFTDVCINLSWDGERDGEYEEYVKHSYPLDSDLELRGIPKLDASNNLYYDGDTYESDGTVTRKYGVHVIQDADIAIDQGALSYENMTPIVIFNLDGMLKSLYKQAIHSTFGEGVRAWPFDSTSNIHKFMVNPGNNAFWFGFTKGTTLEQAKAVLVGTTIVYELETPTTEEADPYQNPQIVDDFGTEEYVDAGVTASTRDVAIPVGHNTKYQPNLRAKLEMLPNSPDGDGDYLMRQSNGENSFVPFVKELPALPSEDGTYVLKCTVSGSTKTLGWVEEE